MGDAPLLLIPVLLFLGTGLGLFFAFRRSSSRWVLRLAALFGALWALLATTALVALLSLGGFSAMRAAARTSALMVTPASWELWVFGAVGAVAVLALAFALNQAVGRGFLALYAARPYPWPESLPVPSGRISLGVTEGARPDAFSFTLLEVRSGGHLFSRHDVILLSEGLLATLDEDELIAVLAHELGHVRDLDSRYLTFLRTLSRMMRWDPVLAFLADTVTRQEEYRADAEAARITRRPRLLAQALFRVLAAPAEAPSAPGSAFLGIAGPRGRREALRRIHRLLELADSPEFREDRRG